MSVNSVAELHHFILDIDCLCTLLTRLNRVNFHLTVIVVDDVPSGTLGEYDILLWINMEQPAAPLRCSKNARESVVELCAQHGQDNTGSDTLNACMDYICNTLLASIQTARRRGGDTTKLVRTRSVCAVSGSVTQLTWQRLVRHKGGTTLPRNRPRWQACRATCSFRADIRFRP